MTVAGQGVSSKISAVGPKGFDAAEHKRLIRQEDFMRRFAVNQGDFDYAVFTKELVWTSVA